MCVLVARGRALPAGAGWDFEAGCLCEPAPLELVVPMPIIHFKPVEGRGSSTSSGGKAAGGAYACPLFLTQQRGQATAAAHLGAVELKAGGADAEHWVMRGTALLLSLAS